jgi:hypothetical protein
METPHPELVRIVNRHKQFYAGERGCLIKISIEPQKNEIAEENAPRSKEIADMRDRLLSWPQDNDSGWDDVFKPYYMECVRDAAIRAKRRLDMGLGDDCIPFYQPSTGSAEHHALFGGKVAFGGGTSWVRPVIGKACEYEGLRFDLSNIWVRRITEAMAYARDNGRGVLPASLRGGNGPLDMANGAMGDAVFTELLDDEEGMRRILDICAEACEAMYRLQQDCASHIMGGYIGGHGNLWIPAPMFGHVSADASLLTGPELYSRFEKKRIECLAAKFGGLYLHTHMVGWRMFGEYAKTDGVKIMRPANDPNQKTLVGRLEETLDAIGGVILVIPVEPGELGRALEVLGGRRAVFEISAAGRDDALRQMEQIGKRYAI